MVFSENFSCFVGTLVFLPVTSTIWRLDTVFFGYIWKVYAKEWFVSGRLQFYPKYVGDGVIYVITPSRSASIYDWSFERYVSEISFSCLELACSGLIFLLKLFKEWDFWLAFFSVAVEPTLTLSMNASSDRKKYFQGNSFLWPTSFTNEEHLLVTWHLSSTF